MLYKWTLLLAGVLFATVLGAALGGCATTNGELADGAAGYPRDVHSSPGYDY